MQKKMDKIHVVLPGLFSLFICLIEKILSAKFKIQFMKIIVNHFFSQLRTNLKSYKMN